MLIPLKAKYRSAHRGRFHGGERAAPKKHRNKIGYESHVKLHGVPPKYTLVVDCTRGTSVMQRVD